jgi:hypothetical protein
VFLHAESDEEKKDQAATAMYAAHKDFIATVREELGPLRT